MLSIAPVFFVLAVLPPAPAPAGGARAFEAARRAAIANAKSARGRRYQPVLAKAFSESQARQLGRCVESRKDPDLSPFEALVEIGAGGAVESVLVRPGTNVAVCLRESILKTRFPRPPRAHYWTSTTLRLTQ
ncbi:MAG: hypothetical protein ACRD16_10765 [Thermoanaerobaculia bacterium]